MSSKRAERRRSCERKLTYDSLEEALAAKREIWRVHRDSLTAYRCRFCSQFHLGHAPQRVRRSIAARRRERG